MPGKTPTTSEAPKHGPIYKLIEGIAIAYIIGASIVLPVVGMIAYLSVNESNDLYEMNERLLKTNAYLFNNANTRGLLDICTNAAGEQGVWFKEDCKK